MPAVTVCILWPFQEETAGHNAFPAVFIRRATELAYDENADQIIGKIDGEWAIANNEDVARIANMDAKTTFRVCGYGIDTADFMATMERMGIEGDQDWQAETTTYEIDDECAVVDGTCIRFVPKIMIRDDFASYGDL